VSGDVAAQVSVTPGARVRVGKGKRGGVRRFRQTLVVTNLGAVAIQGPLQVILASLPRKRARLAGGNAVTVAVPGGVLRPGETASAEVLVVVKRGGVPGLSSTSVTAG
jgi:hypothetical protein